MAMCAGCIADDGSGTFTTSKRKNSMARFSDTSPEAERVLVEVFRRMPAERKWLQLGQMFQDARYLHAIGVRLQTPDATERQIQESWLDINLGFKDRKAIREPARMGPLLNLNDVRQVASVFDSLGIPYALGGSMASSIHGIGRYTQDADLTAEPFPGKEAAFAQRLFGKKTLRIRPLSSLSSDI